MNSLVPCSACARHVRRQDARCPFCGTARTPSAGPFREVMMPRDATRATLFALGLSLAGQACGGRTDGDNDPSAPGSGASVGIGAGGGGNAMGGSGGRANSGTCYDNPLLPMCSPAPPYGNIQIPFPATGGSAGSAGMPDAAVPQGSEDAGSSDAGSGDAGSDAGG
jgi:hypothetical protein